MDVLSVGVCVLLFLINGLILLSGLDDAFIDAYYWIRTGIRQITVRRHHPRFDLSQLHGRPEACFAILVPAWREFSVIASMVETTQSVLEYENYVIFVGTYVNDMETRAEVDRMARRYRRVRRVEVPHPGPTCKADCLNWILRAVFDQERVQGRPFAGMVLHDAEDVIHPFELKVFNYFIDRKDMIQLPVLSLEQGLGRWVAATYQDDFAESHSKDMVVRESITGLVPCAGTGVCYSRRAMESLCAHTDQAPFNTASLTEDYDFSFRLRRLGHTQAFVQLPLQYTVPGSGRGGQQELHRSSLLGIRENFPDTFRKAYRQRSRWILGISLQGWEAFGWAGNLRAKYFMFRDRKGLFTSLINIVAYALFLVGTVLHVRLGHSLSGSSWSFGLAFNAFLIKLMELNGIFMANRVLQRFIFVRRHYGLAHGLLAIPRIIVNNAINFAAVLRAWRLFILHRLTGRPLAWDKTAHVFPTQKELQPLHRKLGEILLEWQALDEAELQLALGEQKAKGLPLGQVLLTWNTVSTDVLADAIACQANLPRSALDLDRLAQTCSLAPKSLMLRYGMVPLGLGEDEELLLGAAVPPTPEALAALTLHLARMPRFFILSGNDLALGLAYVAMGAPTAQALEPQGCRLLEDYLIKRILGGPPTLAATTAFPVLENQEQLRTFLAGRRLPSPSLVSEDASLA